MGKRSRKNDNFTDPKLHTSKIAFIVADWINKKNFKILKKSNYGTGKKIEKMQKR